MTLMDSWIYLCVAILFGVLGTISMKLSHGLKRWKPSVCLFIFYVISFAAMTLALRGIDISIVYATWSGIGTIFVAIVGVYLFEEAISINKIFSLSLVVLGVVGIHLTNAFH